VQRLPWTRSFILGDAIRVFGGRTVRGHVADARNGAADIQQRKPHSASDRGIRLHARSKGVVARVDSKLPCHRTIENEERRARVRRGLN
jgi:hypothetical protein